MHTHRRWAHVLASLCVRPAVCTRAREAMISENTAARVDQWQHADSPAGQPAIRDDEIGGTERTRAERMTGWDDGGGEENGQGLRRVIMNVCCRRPSFSLLQPADGSSSAPSNRTILYLLLHYASYFR